MSKVNTHFITKGNPAVNRSFTSDGSFSSFGSADENATLMIMNPNEFTVSHEEDVKRSTVLNDSSEANEEIRNPYKEEEEMNKVIVKI